MRGRDPLRLVWPACQGLVYNVFLLYLDGRRHWYALGSSATVDIASRQKLQLFWCVTFIFPIIGQHVIMRWRRVYTRHCIKLIVSISVRKKSHKIDLEKVMHASAIGRDATDAECWLLTLPKEVRCLLCACLIAFSIAVV